jgi:Protein of unknown function (DUF4232)
MNRAVMNRRAIARGALLATTTAAALALAACGSGTNNASGTSSTTTSASNATFVPVTSTTAPANAQSTTVPVGGGNGETGGGSQACPPTDLKLSLGPTNGAAGHIYQPLQFTNAGKQPCLLVGFPGVSYVTGDSGTQVGAPAERDGNTGPRVTLQPGQMAYATIIMTDVGVFDANVCKPTTTRGFRVYPPNTTAALFVAQNGTGCAGNPPSPQLRVQTIKPGNGIQ